MWKTAKLVLGCTAIGGLLGVAIGTALLGVPGGLVGGTIGTGTGGGIGLILALGGALSDRFPRWTQHLEFECPHSHRNVKATVLENSDTHQIFEVETCSRFEPAHQIRCKKGCLQDLNAGTVSAAMNP